jgi:hypothetical protein
MCSGPCTFAFIGNSTGRDANTGVTAAALGLLVSLISGHDIVKSLGHLAEQARHDIDVVSRRRMMYGDSSEIAQRIHDGIVPEVQS